MPQYVVVGLGGTGCAVVRDLKKKLYIEWRSRGNTGPYPEIFSFEDEYGAEKVESRIATLSVDSNEADLSGEGERLRGWRVFGETLRLRDHEKVLLDPAGLDRVLSSIERYPGIYPWVKDDMDFVRDITRGTTEPAGCNQIRRMGRLALANGNGIQRVIDAVSNRLNELCKNRQVEVEIHIACTLAAGTGSGTIIDVVAQLQRYLRNQPGEYKVFLHGFTTIRDVGDTNTANFYANQYAALVELNAFRLGIYQPWDIAASQKPSRLALPREEGKAAGDLRGTFKSLALITDNTEGGVNVPFERQIDNVAEFIFQVAVRQMGDLPKPVREALSAEDRNQYPTDVNGGNRSTAFIGYGVQRMAIPEREIREKLSYSFARQFTLKFLFNNWNDRYRDSPREFATAEFVDKQRRLWKVTRQHLYLDLIQDVAGQNAYELYETDWLNELAKQAARVREQLGEDSGRWQWLADFDRRAEKYWREGFRPSGDAGGVVDYFKIRGEQNEIATRARRIRARIEEDLILGIERMDSDYALTYLPDAIEFLGKRIDDDREEFGNLEHQAESSLKDANRTRVDIRKQYDKCGRWAKSKQEKLFGEYIIATTSYYRWQTILKAAPYGQAFCLKLIEELKDLQHQILEFSIRMKLLAKNFDQEIKHRINEKEGIASSDEVEYLVDFEYVNKSISDLFEADKALQDLKAFVAMEKLKALRGDRVEFAAYVENTPVDGDRVGGALVDVLYQVSEQSAIEAHHKVREDNKEFEGILGQNIIRRLYNDHGGQVEGRLEQKFRDLIDKAMPMVSFDPNEERMDLATQGPVLRRCVFFPKCSKYPAFEQHLRDRISGIIGGRGACQEVKTICQEIPEDRNPTEITIISVAFFFSARFTRVVHGLQTKYMERLQQNKDRESLRGSFEVHTESHQPPLPELMKLHRKGELEGGLPFVLLAYALGLMHVKEDGQDVLFGRKDEWGRIQNKVVSNMVMTAEIRNIAAESSTRFGREIPADLIVLYSLYIKEFDESALAPVEALVRSELEKDIDIEAMQSKLSTVSGQSFLLGGSNDHDQTYELFDRKSNEASEFALRLSKKASLKSR